MKTVDIYTMNEAVEAITTVKESDYRELEAKYEKALEALRRIKFYVEIKHDALVDYGTVAEQGMEVKP